MAVESEDFDQIIEMLATTESGKCRRTGAGPQSRRLGGFIWWPLQGLSQWQWALRKIGHERMYRFVTLAVISLWGTIALGHHSVIGVYDDKKRFTVEVEVRNFELIDPHPLILVDVIDIPDGQEIDGIAIGQTWTLEMDNARELVALGFDNETFIPGDRILVAVDPSRHTRYRENTLYLRAAEHRRQGFVYIHNARQLFPIDAAADNLSKHLHRIR